MTAKASFAHWQNFSVAGPSFPFRVMIPIVTRFGSGVRRTQFDAIVERIIERVRGERHSGAGADGGKTPDQPSCSSTRRGLSFTRAKIAFKIFQVTRILLARQANERFPRRIR